MAAHDYLLINHPNLNIYSGGQREEACCTMSTRSGRDGNATFRRQLHRDRLGLTNLSLTADAYGLPNCVGGAQRQSDLQAHSHKALSSMEAWNRIHLYRWIHLISKRD